MPQTLSIYVNNRPGVLNRVTSVFRHRGINIEALTAAASCWNGISRVTLDIDVEEIQLARLEATLYKLLDVRLVEQNSAIQSICRELLLLKISATGNFCLPDGLIKRFNLRIAHKGAEFLILEAIGVSSDLEDLMEVLRPWGIQEIARTGKAAIECQGPSSHLEDYFGSDQRSQEFTGEFTNGNNVP